MLLTPWGAITGLRLPRVRDVASGEEVGLFGGEREEARLAEMLLSSTLGGLSYRKVVSWARRHLGLVLSTAWVSRVVEAAAERIAQRRTRRFSARAFEALVVDAVWVRYRRGVKRRTRSGALLVAVGVQWGGSFQVLDWQVADTESAEAYEALFQRLYERGLEEVPLVVADGCGSVRPALEVVYPGARLQPCLQHWFRNLEQLLQPCSWLERRRLRREFLWIYEADSVEQAHRWARRFSQRWARRQPLLVRHFNEGLEASLTFLRNGVHPWTYRLRTTNLAEGFFHHLRRFLSRFPGFVDPHHAERALGLYLLGAETL
jgi:transposase-like protein